MSLHQFLLILRARWRIVLVSVAAALTLAVLINLFLPKSYTVSTSVIIDSKATDSAGGNILPVQLVARYIATQIDIIKSQKVALKVVRDLQLVSSQAFINRYNKVEEKISIEDWIAIQLLGRLRVEPSRESNVINISYSSTDPVWATTVVNAFAKAYIDASLELRVEPARQVASWFDQQTKVLRSELERTQAKLSNYQREKGIITLDERLDVEGARLMDISTQLVQAENSAYDSENRDRQAKQLANGSSADTLPEILSNSFIQSLKGDLLRKEAKYKEISENLGENHPERQKLKAEILSLRNELKREYNVITSGVTNSNKINKQRESELRSAFGNQKSKLLSLKIQRDELAVLVRDVENAQRAYDAALQKFTQANLESQATQANVAILNPAVTPIDSRFLKLARDLLIAGVLGVLLGIGLALFNEIVDQRVRSIRDISGVIGLPVLGVLQKSKQRRLPRIFNSPYLLTGKG